MSLSKERKRVSAQFPGETFRRETIEYLTCPAILATRQTMTSRKHQQKIRQRFQAFSVSSFSVSYPSISVAIYKSHMRFAAMWLPSNCDTPCAIDARSPSRSCGMPSHLRAFRSESPLCSIGVRLEKRSRIRWTCDSLSHPGAPATNCRH